jgi:hypothetical protein
MVIVDSEHEKNERRPTLLDDVDPPPLYVPPLPDRKPLPRVPPPPRLSATNYIDISRTEHPVKGVWTIDTSVTLHPTPQSPGKPNLRLATRQGSVHATVSLRGTSKATLHAASDSGSVTFCIVRHYLSLSAKAFTDSIVFNQANRTGPAFRLQIVAQDGDTHIYLPPTFYGPIQCKWRRSESHHKIGAPLRTPIFSASLEPYLIALSSIEEDKDQYDVHSVFLGDLAAETGDQSSEDAEWNDDEVFVELDYRSQAYFFWASEAVDSTSTASTEEPSGTRLASIQKALKPFVSKSKRKSSE